MNIVIEDKELITLISKQVVKCFARNEKKENKTLKEDNRTLKKENKTLKKQLAKMKKRLAKMKKMMSTFHPQYQESNKDFLKRTQGHMCQYCKTTFDETTPPTKEHLIPKSHCGPSCIANLVLVCKACNSKRGNALDNTKFLDALRQKLTTYSEGVAKVHALLSG